MRNTIPGLPAHTCAVPCRTVLSPHYHRKPSDHHTRFRSHSRAPLLPLPFLFSYRGLPYIRCVHSFPMLWHYRYRPFVFIKIGGRGWNGLPLFLHAIPLPFLHSSSFLESSHFIRGLLYFFACNKFFLLFDIFLYRYIYIYISRITSFT